MRLASRELQVDFDVRNAAFDVVQKKGGARWVMDRADTRDLLVHRFGREERVLSLAKARKVRETVFDGGASARVEYGGFPGIDSSLSVAVVLSLAGSELAVELDVNDADPDYVFDSMYWPRSFLLPERKDAYWIFPVGGGALIPATHRVNQDARLGWRPTLKCHGAVVGEAGFLCLWDTPWDTYLATVNTPRTGTKMLPRLRSSLGRFRYTRRLRFVFEAPATYAGLIRGAYRPWAMKRGYVRTLRDKTRENPNVADLAGGMVFHQLIGYVNRRNLQVKMVPFDHAAAVIRRVVQATGVGGCYHLDGWCRQGYDALHPDVFPPWDAAGGEDGLRALSRAVKRLGLHFGLHDNYLLFFPDAERYRDRHAVFGPDGECFRDQFRAGGMNFVQSMPAARQFIIANYLTGQQLYRRRWPPAGKTYGLEFCYLDQYLLSGGSIEEDFNPAHPLSREQFALGMLENIRIMRERVGCITSSEHMFDFGMALYDVNGNSSGVAPHHGPGLVPAPLWNLGLHECMAVTHAVGYGGRVDAAERKRRMVMTALMGGMLHHGGGYMDTPEQVDEAIGLIKAAAPLRKVHRALMYRQCTDSRLLAADGSRQIADYEGITVEADFTRGTAEVAGDKTVAGRYDFSEA